MAKTDFRKGQLPFQFVPLPKDVLASPEYQGLPTSAKALMLDLMGQYTGKNNGRLCTAFEAMKRCGWTAPNTLTRAKRALLECPFAMLTRKGHPPRTAEWVGFTWWKLDWHESMDIGPRGFPYLNFVPVRSIDPNEGRDAAKKSDRVVQKLYRCDPISALRGTETVPMKASA